MTLNVVGVFCEDIREEKSGQVSLVGILPDNINVPMPPADKPHGRAMIPKLGVYVRIHIDVNYDPGPMSLSLLLPDGAEIELGSVEETLIEKSKREAHANQLPIAGLISQAVLMGFVLPGPGVIMAILTVAKEKRICAVLNARLVEQSDSASKA